MTEPDSTAGPATSLPSPAPPAAGKSPAAVPEVARPRMVGLDVMRFVAVMMVLYAHADGFPSTRKFFLAKIGWFYDALYELRQGAWVAVDLFFVLSGFLISGLLFQELAKTGTVSVGRFLIRRGFKIYPPFWVMLAATVIGCCYFNGTFPLKTLLTELCFVQNYVVGDFPTYKSTFWGITWSLAVEEHFYFLLALVFFILKKRAGAGQPLNIHILPKLFLVVAGGCLVARFITWYFLLNEPKTRNWFFFATHARMDAIFFGVLLSYYWNNRWDDAFKARLLDRRWTFAGAALALLFTAIYRYEGWFAVFGYVLTYLGAGYLLVSLLSLDRAPCHASIRGMAWLGQHSYSVYLWHILAGSWLLPLITLKTRTLAGWTTNLLIYIVMSWVVGVCMSLLVDYPSLRLRDRWFPRLRPGSIRPAAGGA